MARPRSDIRARLVSAARKRFLRDGVDGASLRDIAAAARTNIGMVYYYFPEKDALFLAAVEDAYAGLLEGVREALAGDAPVRVRLLRLYARLWRMNDDEYATLRLVLREAMISSTRMRKLAPRFLQGHVPLILGALLEGRARGELRDDREPLIQMAAVMSLGIMPVLARRIAADAVPRGFPLPPLESMAPALAEMLFAGIGQPMTTRASTRGASTRGAPRTGAKAHRAK
jgi:AcrR family transcriptional regulator